MYARATYRGQAQEAERSAAVVAPMLRDRYDPRSIVDVGCGAGAWLAAFKRLGVNDLLGLDAIPPELFTADADLRWTDLGDGFHVPHRFDLALCLEVAEHLPERSARRLVASLCAATDVVVFSAAIPGQGGPGHVNEQWPSYWGRLFASQSFGSDCWLRWAVWDEPEVSPWYRQNLLVFSRYLGWQNQPHDLIHPAMLRQMRHPWLIRLRSLSDRLRP
jgi:SAM-dependent methyltransferase